ncbi:MAG: TRAP transporter small permease [Reyranella sp.]|uniref:TRAP transporter small permease subunit n=1 Tax=Reyranella sp. TaxID=1929291 RepID=UPI00272F5203|nr:TRAP transporter small permease [Reyranella sp.]MDP1962737.1 TRAP transporter small permease [Reyranella sp.]MDP2375678.1 TRAP transporter small permease [Reyranella sp.]
MIGVRRFAQWGLWFGGALVLLAAVLIGVDVLMRKFLARSIGGADELAGYALAIGTAWGLGATLLDRAHIRIDSLYMLFPQKLRLVLDAVAIVLLVGFFALTTWHGLGVVSQSWTSDSRSQSALETPTIIPQALWIAGLAAFVVIGALLLLQALRTALSGDLRGVATLISTRSAEEEVEDEIRDLKDRQMREGKN